MTTKRRRPLGLVMMVGLGAAGLAMAGDEQPPLPTGRAAEFSAAVAAAGPPFLDLDGPASAVGLSPRLMLPELATSFRGPSGQVTYLPVHVSQREGGRRSLLALAPGETSTVGLYVVGGAAYERQVTRRQGAGPLARGDRLDEQIVNAAGESVQKLSYVVAAVDHQAGTARFANLPGNRLSDGDIVNGQDGWCWSCNGGSSWWCGFPCFPDPIDVGTTTAR